MCNGPKSAEAQVCGSCLRFGEITTDSIPGLMALIQKVLLLGNLKPEYVDVLLSHESKYTIAFTAFTYDPVFNYEIYEHLGDGVVNSFLSWYFYRRFNQLNCPNGLKILARLKSNYASKGSFSVIAENLGFWPFIRASAEQRRTYKPTLLEDVFEAFIGVTVEILDTTYTIGAGYGIVYRILETIFNGIEISLDYENLYDTVSKLKEMFEHYKAQLGTHVYEDESSTVVKVYRVFRGAKTLLGTGVGQPQKGLRKQEAARQALELLKSQGFVRQESYRLVCNV